MIDFGLKITVIIFVKENREKTDLKKNKTGNFILAYTRCIDKTMIRQS